MPPSCLRQRGESPPPLVSGRRPGSDAPASQESLGALTGPWPCSRFVRRTYLPSGPAAIGVQGGSWKPSTCRSEAFKINNSAAGRTLVTSGSDISGDQRAGRSWGTMRIRCQRSRLPKGGYRAADQVCPSYRTRQLAGTGLAEAPTGEVACEAAVDQRVHSRGLVGEQGIHHLRRNAVLACTGFDDQRRELLGTVRVAAQLGDADRAAVPFADDELLPVQTGRIEPCPPHHRGDDRLIIWPCPPHHSLHPAIIAPTAGSCSSPATR